MEDTNLKKVQEEFESSTRTPLIEATIEVRRRRRAKKFLAEDILFVVSFAPGEQGALSLLNVLTSIYEVVLTLLRRLRSHFKADEKTKRIVFFSANTRDMVSSLFTGGQDLHGQSLQSLANAIMRPLFLFCTSHQTVSLDSELNIKCSVISIQHSVEYLAKRARNRPLPEDKMYGALKSTNDYAGRNYGYIIVPKGTRNQPNLFDKRCLVIAFVIGKRIAEASWQGEKELKKTIFKLRGLCQRRFISAKQVNTIGSSLWSEAKHMLDRICTKDTGPYGLQCLEDLAKSNNIQVILFSGLMNEPTHIFPSDLKQPRPDLPTVYLKEVINLTSEENSIYHINVIIHPQLLSRGRSKFHCKFCLKMIRSGRHHRYCPKRKTCFSCRRLLCHQDDHFGFLDQKQLCPSYIRPLNHPAISFLNGGEGAECGKCDQIIYTKCCLKIHKKECKGKKKCSKCHQLVIARGKENLEDKMAEHECMQKRCMTCYQMIPMTAMKTHHCKLAKTSFPKGYNHWSTLDIESFTYGPNKQHRDCMLVFSYETTLAGVFNRITFVHQGFHLTMADSIEKHIYSYDYIPPELHNEIDTTTGQLTPRKAKDATEKKHQKKGSSQTY